MLDCTYARTACVLSLETDPQNSALSHHADHLSSTAAWRVATRSNPGGPMYATATFLFNDVGDVVKFTALDSDKVTRA